MGLLEKLKRKRVGAKNPVFVEAGRRGGIRSGEVRRARAERRRSLEAEASPTEVAERVKALLRTPMEPGPSEPIEVTASPASMEPIPREEMEEEGGAPEASAFSSLYHALETMPLLGKRTTRRLVRGAQGSHRERRTGENG